MQGTYSHGDTMLELGRQWCEIVGTDPNNPDPGSAGTPNGSSAPPPSGGASGGTPSPSPFAGAIGAVLDNVAAKVARENAPGTPPPKLPPHRHARTRRARAMSTAGVRDGIPVKTTSVVPPGRLRMRGALAADAQRPAGAILVSTNGASDRVELPSAVGSDPGNTRLKLFRNTGPSIPGRNGEQCFLVPVSPLRRT